MQVKSYPMPHRRPPRGLIEAAAKLDGWEQLNLMSKERRLRKSRESLTFAIAWAKRAAADSDIPDSSWLAEKVNRMQRAEQLLKLLLVDAERQADGCQGRVSELRELFYSILRSYTVSVPPSASAVSESQNTVVSHSTCHVPEVDVAPVAIDVKDALINFQATVEEVGLRDGLAYLVQLTRYRFAGLWQFLDGDQKALAYFDRQDTEIYTPQGSGDRCNGCIHVATRAGIRSLDELLSGHVEHRREKRQARTFRSVPIVGGAGEVLATLCLYDSVARYPTLGEQVLLERCSRFLAGNQTFITARRTDGVRWRT